MTNSGGGIEAEQNFDAWGRRRDKDSWALLAPTAATGLPVWLYRGYTGHEMLDNFGIINMNGRLYDPVLGRMLSPDNYVADGGFTQDYNRYTYARNNPLKYVDPSGEVFFITPQIGFGKGGFSLGLEIGIGFKGGASISVAGGYNFKSNKGYWSAQGGAFGFYGGYGSSGSFAGFGYRHPSGVTIGGGYNQAGGWNVGIGMAGNQGNFAGAAGIGWSQKGGFDWNVSGGYTFMFEGPSRKKIAEYTLQGASEKPLRQRDAYDCLVCASEYIEQLSNGQGREYEDILNELGMLYNSNAGTDTKAGLEKLYGTENVDASSGGNPNLIGREMQKGNPTILAQNKNHALVVTKIEIWSKQFSGRVPKTYFNIQVFNPATGNFPFIKNYRWNEPTFRIRINK